MGSELIILIGLAAAIGFGHTVLGPDHYLPFIMIAKARKWELPQTAWITFLSGLGHVLSSVLLGLIGIAFGIMVTKLEFIEAMRGEMAAWLLIGFGSLYFIWGIRSAFRGKKHKHLHLNKDGSLKIAEHTHAEEHLHVHEQKADITPWVLFAIFVFGPCEPLIPLLMYPAAKGSVVEAILVATVFSVITITTMLVIVLAGSLGLRFMAFERMEKYNAAIAGAVICLSGLAIKFLGL